MEKLIKVKVKTNEKENSIKKVKDDEFLVKTKSPRELNKANQSVFFILSDYFKIPAGNIKMVKGACSTSKIFRINL